MAFFGDSQHIVDLWARTQHHTDLFLFMCVELAHDLLMDWVYSATWIPREYNSLCDALVWTTGSTGMISVDVDSTSSYSWLPYCADALRDTCVEFVTHFARLACGSARPAAPGPLVLPT